MDPDLENCPYKGSFKRVFFKTCLSSKNGGTPRFDLWTSIGVTVPTRKGLGFKVSGF